MSVTSIGKFEILGTLGTGAHSTILHIRRAEDGKQYALKVVSLDGPEDQKFLDQAEHELQVASLLGHPNLVKVHCLEKVKNWFFQVKKAHLLIEHVNGKTLDQVPRLTLPRLAQVLRQAADGVVHMHRRQVCHGDLKPNNVMLSKAGEVKILDFGLARIRGKGTGRVQGTPEYMAPEQAKHQMINERTDIYNFGAMMYRLASWKLPVPCVSEEDGNIPLDIKMWARVFKPVEEANPRLPPELAALINQCLQFDANKRPERMSEVQGTLDRLADDLVKKPEDGLEGMEW
ncbi:MAG: serine/threonine protein kinase [Gemmataceae bacterium]|nr:serine/threonine protein kinase [Gemmataceae bacterium]